MSTNSEHFMKIGRLYSEIFGWIRHKILHDIHCVSKNDTDVAD